MPNYTYRNNISGEIREVFQRMTDEHIYIDENGLKWERVFTSPCASVDTKIDAFSSKEFVQKTAKKGMTVGDMWDRSAELSEKREKIIGKDPVKEKTFTDYEKKTKKTHPGRIKKPTGPIYI